MSERAEPRGAEDAELLFADCLDAADTEWNARVEAACVRHPEHADDLRRRLARLTDSYLTPTGLVAGARFGDYDLLRKLGAGGMGIVFLARQRSLDRLVALKLIRPEFLDAAIARQRFDREVETLAGLDHPGICTLYAAGVEEGQPYLAMRYVAGATLAERRRSGELGPPTTRAELERALGVVEQAARALHVAHEQGLVHRDVKPDNLALEDDDRVVVLDFGLGRRWEVGATLTRTGDVVGTPAYMSPEQIDARGRTVDRRSDVYGLGATLFELVTSRAPFEAPTRESLYRKILRGDLERPTLDGQRVDTELEVVLRKALDLDPARRYQTAEELADDLGRWRAHQPVRARRASSWLRARRWAQRNPAASTALAVLAIASVALAFTLLERQLALDLAVHEAALRRVRDTLADDTRLGVSMAAEAWRAEGDEASLSLLAQGLAELREVSRSMPHDSMVHGVLAFEDGERFVVWSQDGSASVRHVGGREIERFELGGWITAAALSPDESWLALGCSRETVAVHAVDGEAEVLLETDGLVRGVGFSGDGERLWTATKSGELALWAWREPAKVATHRVDGTILSATASADRRVLAVGTEAGTAHVYAVAKDELRRIHDGLGPHDGGVTQVVLSADGAVLLTAPGQVSGYARFRRHTRDWSGRVWSLSVDEPKPIVLSGLTNPIWSAALSADGSRAALASQNGVVRLWCLDTDLPVVHEFALVDGGAVPLLAMDEAHVLVGSGAGGLELRDFNGKLVAQLRGGRFPMFRGGRVGEYLVTTGWKAVHVWREQPAGFPVLRHDDVVKWCDSSRDGEFVATASWDGLARVWSTLDGKLVATLREGAEQPVHCVAFTPDGRILTGDGTAVPDSGRVRLWSGQGELLMELMGPGDAPLARGAYRVAADPDGRWLASSDWGTRGRVRIWHADGRFLGDRDLKGECAGLCFSPDGSRLATLILDRGRTVRIWSTSSLKLEHEFLTHPKDPYVLVNSMSWSAEDHLATAADDGSVRIFSPAGDELHVLKHEQPQGIARFDDSGQRIVCGGTGGATVWALVPEPRVLIRLADRGHEVWGAAFVGEQRVVTGAGDGNAKLWWIDPAQLEGLARELVPP